MFCSTDKRADEAGDFAILGHHRDAGADAVADRPRLRSARRSRGRSPVASSCTPSTDSSSSVRPAPISP